MKQVLCLTLSWDLVRSLVVCDIGLEGRTKHSQRTARAQAEHSLIMCNNNIAIPFVSGRRLLSFHRMHMYFTASLATASASLRVLSVAVLSYAVICHSLPFSTIHCHSEAHKHSAQPALYQSHCWCAVLSFASLELLSLRYHFCRFNCYEMSLPFGAMSLMYVRSTPALRLCNGLRTDEYMWYRNIIFVYTVVSV